MLFESLSPYKLIQHQGNICQITEARLNQKFLDHANLLFFLFFASFANETTT